MIIKKVKITGVEAGDRSFEPGEHTARFQEGRIGVLQSTKSYLLQQDKNGQVMRTHSVSAGLNYPNIGPEHSHLYDLNRVHYTLCKR